MWLGCSEYTACVYGNHTLSDSPLQFPAFYDKIKYGDEHRVFPNSLYIGKNHLSNK